MWFKHSIINGQGRRKFAKINLFPLAWRLCIIFIIYSHPCANLWWALCQCQVAFIFLPPYPLQVGARSNISFHCSMDEYYYLHDDIETYRGSKTMIFSTCFHDFLNTFSSLCKHCKLKQTYQCTMCGKYQNPLGE